MPNKHSNIVKRNIDDQVEQVLTAHHEDPKHFKSKNGTVKLPSDATSSTKKDISKLVGVEKVKRERGE